MKLKKYFYSIRKLSKENNTKIDIKNSLKKSNLITKKNISFHQTGVYVSRMRDEDTKRLLSGLLEIGEYMHLERTLFNEHLIQSNYD